MKGIRYHGIAAPQLHDPPDEGAQPGQQFRRVVDIGGKPAGAVVQDFYGPMPLFPLQALDESPMACKSMDEIVAQIGPTADIVEQIRPVYNFKAAD